MVRHGAVMCHAVVVVVVRPLLTQRRRLVCAGTSLFDGGCVSLSPDELAGFPTLSFHIDTATTTTTAPTKGSDVVLEIPPSACVGLLV